AEGLVVHLLVGVALMRATPTAKRKARADLAPRLLSWDGTRERCLRPRVELGGQSVRPTPVNSTWASHYFWRCRFGNYGASPRFQGKSAPASIGPRQAWGHPRPRGSALGLSPGRGPRHREGAKDHLRPNAGPLCSHEN